MAKKILLADDSITIQKVVELTFSDGDYEVTAVNNGARAIAKLAEFRPDIILSDIIMPEKNGYEVCEFVKSHPEYKSIPVVLLTGTFEPFDPDRADKAGCDAVVTKPFESQSLIHKVEELISQSRVPAAAPAAAVPEANDSPWMDDTPAMPSAEDSPFSSASPEPFTHSADIFSAPPAQAPTVDMPFDSPSEPAFGGETRAFPRMTFDELQQMAPPPAPPATPAEPEPPQPSPWDEQPEFGETRAFPRMTFDEMQQMESAPAPQPAAAPESDESPFGAPPPPEEFSGETRAFPRMSFEELSRMASAPAPEPPAAPAEPEPAAPVSESAPWEEQPEPAFGGGETRAFPRMTFDELQQMAPPPAPVSEPEPPQTPEPAPWDEQPAFGGETRAFPRMSFDELQQMASTAPAAPEPVVEEEPWEEPVTASWSPVPEESPVVEEETPFAASAYEPEPEPEPALVSGIADVNPQITDGPPYASAIAEQPPIEVLRSAGGELTDEQIDRIARRVVQLMSDQVVRNIAWEVIPDLAEMCVKERIRQLESEA